MGIRDNTHSPKDVEDIRQDTIEPSSNRPIRREDSNVSEFYDNSDGYDVDKDGSNDTLYFKPRRIYQLDQALLSRGTLMRSSAEDTSTNENNREQSNPNPERVLEDSTVNEYVPNLNYNQLLSDFEMGQTTKKSQRHNLRRHGQDSPSYSSSTTNIIKKNHQRGSQIPVTSGAPSVTTELSRYDSWSMSVSDEEEDIPEEENEMVKIARDKEYHKAQPISFKSTHSQVDPIPLPGKRTLFTPPSALEIERRMSYGHSTTVPNAGSFLQTFKLGSLKGREKRISSRPTSYDSASSSLTFLPDSTLSVFTELEMGPDEIGKLITKLPGDFCDLPYSRRKREIIELVPNKDYKLIMSLIKKFMLQRTTSNTSLQRKPIPGSGPSSVAIPQAAHMKRSRHGSIASQFLSTFSPTVPSSVNGDMNTDGLTLTRPDAVGNVILDHKLGRAIGAGAWGSIRECSDIQSGTRRAMKIVRFKENLNVKKHVRREVSIWEQLKHENILPLLNYKFEESYAMYCLTEFINDGNLYDLAVSWSHMSNSKISLSKRCELTIFLGLQVVSALQYMHSKSICHGDVKLENCLLKKDKAVGNWKVLLCDFGMSRNFGVLSKDTATNLGDDDDEEEEGYCEDEECLETASDSEVETISVLNEENTKITKYPSIPKSKSNSSIFATSKQSKLQKITKNRQFTHDDTELEIYSKRKQRYYGPALTSTNLAKKASEEKLKRIEGAVSGMRSLTQYRPASLNAVPIKKVSELANSSKSLQKTFGFHVNEQEETISGPHLSSQIGSLPYASPELLKESPLCPAADVWALGVMLYTCLLYTSRCV